MLKKELLDIIVCPKCRKELIYKTEPNECLVCESCKLVYQVKEDIPIMLIEEALPLESK